MEDTSDEEWIANLTATRQAHGLDAARYEFPDEKHRGADGQHRLEIAGQDACRTQPRSAPAARFIRDRVMFQNGTYCTAGLDSYCGVPAYLSAKQYEEAGYSRKDLLPFIHRVNHVGGGALGIYGMAADLLITVNGHPLRLDAVVGEMQVATSSLLIGATTMAREDVNAVLFMRDAYAQMRDDNGDTFNFGTKAPTMCLGLLEACDMFEISVLGSDPDDHSATVAVEDEQRDEIATKERQINEMIQQRQGDEDFSDHLRALTTQQVMDETASEIQMACNAIVSVLMPKTGKSTECPTKASERLHGIYSGKPLLDLPLAALDLSDESTNHLRDAQCLYNRARRRCGLALATVSIGPKRDVLGGSPRACDATQTTSADCSGLLGGAQNSKSGGGSGPKGPTESADTGARSTRTTVTRDQVERPSYTTDESDPANQALIAYTRFKALDGPRHATYSKPDNPAAPDATTPSVNRHGEQYSANDFHFFITEMLKEGSPARIAFVDRYGKLTDMPWKPWAHRLVYGTSAERAVAKEQLQHAFDNSDLSAYDDQRRGPERVVTIDHQAKLPILKAIDPPVEEQPAPADLHGHSRLADEASQAKVTATDYDALKETVGALESGLPPNSVVDVCDCPQAEAHLGSVDASDVEFRHSDVSAVRRRLLAQDYSNKVTLDFGSVVPGTQLTIFPPTADGEAVIAAQIVDVAAARKWTNKLASGRVELCTTEQALSDEERRAKIEELLGDNEFYAKLTNASTAGKSKDIMTGRGKPVTTATGGDGSTVDRDVRKVITTVKVDSQIFQIKYQKEDYENALTLQLLEGARFGKVDYRRQNLNLLPEIAKQLDILLRCKFYDRGMTSWSCPVLAIRKPAKIDHGTGKMVPGGIRVTGDLRASNAISRQISYPTAHSGDCLSSLQEIATESYRQYRCNKEGLRTSLRQDHEERPLNDHKRPDDPDNVLIGGGDLQKAFFRVPLQAGDGVSQELGSLNCRGLGTYRALVCSQGLKQSPAAFARFVAVLLEDTGILYQPGVYSQLDEATEEEWKQFINVHSGIRVNCVPSQFMLIYCDDFLLLSYDTEQHFIHWLSVIFWLKKKQFYLALEKCQIACRAVDFLGWVVGYDFQAPRPDRVEALALIPSPTTVKAVRRALGGLQFYGDTVEGFQELTAPMHRMTKNDVTDGPNGNFDGLWTLDLPPSHDKYDTHYETHWITRSGKLVEKDDEYRVSCETGFNIAKARVAWLTLLNQPDFSQPFWIAVDASQTGYGAVIGQQRNGKIHPLSFHSGHFDTTKRKWASVVREFYGLRMAAWKFRWMILGSRAQVFVITDCKPVSGALRFKINNELIARWTLELLQFDLVVHWKPGTSAILQVADTLSRDRQRTANDGAPFELSKALSEFDVTKSPQEQGWNGPTLPWEAEPYQKLKLYKHITDSDGDVEAIEVSAIDPEDNMTIGVIAQKQIDSARHGDLLDNGFNVEIGSVEFGEAGPDDDIIAALSQPYGPDDWIREAEDLLQLGGESVWTDSDGTEFVCNVRQETAIEQRCLIDRHQCDIAALMCGNIKFSRGGEEHSLPVRTAHQVIGCIVDTVETSSIEIFATGKNKPKHKSEAATHAMGRVVNGYFIAAENDTFRTIGAKLGIEPAKLFDWNPRLHRGRQRVYTNHLLKNSVVNISEPNQPPNDDTTAPNDDGDDTDEVGMSSSFVRLEASAPAKEWCLPSDYEMADDEHIRSIYKELQRGRSSECYQLTDQGFLLFFDKKQQLWLTVLPTVKSQKLAIEMVHLQNKGHPTAAEQIDQMKRLVYFSGMATQVKKYVNACSCTTAKRRVRSKFGPLDLIEFPMEPNVVWHIDFITGLPESGLDRCDAVFTITDRFSNNVWAYPVSTTITAKEAADVLLERLILGEGRGLPAQTISDRGSQYVGEMFAHIMQLMGVQTSWTIGHHSLANGKVERVHGYLWRLLVGPGLDQRGWRKRLPYALFHIKNKPCDKSAKYSPNEVECGRRARTPVEATPQLMQVRKASVPVEEHMRELQFIHAEVEEAARIVEDYMRQWYDSKRSVWKHADKLVPGAKVWLASDSLEWPVDKLQPCRKLRQRWVGPFSITKRLRHGTFELNLGMAGSKHHNVYHISSLKPYVPGERPGDAEYGLDFSDEYLTEQAARPGADDSGELDPNSHEVEKILRHRKDGKQISYLVKFKHFSVYRSSWVKAADLEANSAIESYRRKLKARETYVDSAWPEGDGPYRVNADIGTVAQDNDMLNLSFKPADDDLHWVASMLIEADAIAALTPTSASQGRCASQVWGSWCQPLLRDGQRFTDVVILRGRPQPTAWFLLFTSAALPSYAAAMHARNGLSSPWQM